MSSTHVSLHIHVIFSTKSRRPIIDKSWRARLHAYLGGAVRGVEAVPVIVGGTSDHIHLLIGLRATHKLADVMREIKRASSHWVNSELKIHGFAWQSGYGAFSVSPSAIKNVVQYIANQETHHNKRTFQLEYMELLHDNGVEYDERYIWD